MSYTPPAPLKAQDGLILEILSTWTKSRILPSEQNFLVAYFD